MGPTLLTVNSIEVIYNHVILVLKGVSLTVPEGGIVALLGGNGAGKTTLLRAVSNLLKGERGEVTKGYIEYRGERIDRLTPADLVKRGVVQVMEGRHCFQHLTVEENLLTGAYTRGSAAATRTDLEKVYAYFPRLKERRDAQSGRAQEPRRNGLGREHDALHGLGRGGIEHALDHQNQAQRRQEIAHGRPATSISPPPDRAPWARSGSAGTGCPATAPGSCRQ